ncbi:MAG: glycoside hydrolase family 2 protein [Saprospiraceae bacterium]
MNCFLFRSTFLLLLLLPTLVWSQQKILLHQNWEFQQKGESLFYPATVPGTVHQDLRNAGVIEDLYFENNEHRYQWIEEKDWTYQTSFVLDQVSLANEQQDLVFEGLDTYANIYLNNQLIGEANNMFRTWRIPVRQHLKLGKNTLRIVFRSPLTENKSRVENAPYTLPAGCETVPLKVSPYTRKAAYHFGWDWGPRVVSCGIWKAVYLETWNKARIKHFWGNTVSLEKAKATLKLSLELEKSPNYQGNLSIRIDDKKYELTTIQNGKTQAFTVEVLKPKLWWPHTHGKPNLQEFKLQLFAEDQLLDEQTLRMGIRQIELIHEKDSIGTAFYFKVNGQAIYIKGANYIPQDLLIPNVKPAQYKRLLEQSVAANMNMLRVWGGGIYEQDLFYELCDEKGILVWQDFMFAGSMYPNDTSFLANVKAEVSDNIKRLRHHPCLAVWCGNNEMDVAWHNWGWQKQYQYSPSDSSEIWQNYLQIFHTLIPEAIKNLDPERAYTSTSPLSNWGTAENFNHASMHYWGVWHGREPFKNFNTNVGRFMVEYGFQSFPALTSLKKVMHDSSLYLNSLAMKNRQKSYIGNEMIAKHIERNFRPAKSFTDFIELSQATQALGMKIAIQAHRKARPHCMGTLFWQLNDCWPGPSWSVIDYEGNPKLAYQTVKDNFQPVIAVMDTSNQNFKVHLISDAITPFQGKLVLKVNDSEKTAIEKSYPVYLAPHGQKVFSLKRLNKKLSSLSQNNLEYQIQVFNQKKELIFKDQIRY